MGLYNTIKSNIINLYCEWSVCFDVPIYTAHVLYDQYDGYKLTQNWQLLTHLAALDALLVTKKAKISCEAVTPPLPTLKWTRSPCESQKL